MIPHFRYNRTYDVPLNHEQCRQYVSDIVELKRDNLSLVEKVRRAAARARTRSNASSSRFSLLARRASACHAVGAAHQVERLTKFCDSAAFFCRPDFVQARGVRYLVELATSPGSDVDAVSGARSLAPGTREGKE